METGDSKNAGIPSSCFASVFAVLLNYRRSPIASQARSSPTQFGFHHRIIATAHYQAETGASCHPRWA